mmetsp:Transcript_64521/g.114707  ORF Transcript_64521/g.114707 Transcript_64521/m.114707 type:complete len:145 (+) Transcript_64521:92-526(+)
MSSDAVHRQQTYHERRLPCPERIIDMVGSAFGIGCCGGFALTFVRGFRDHPKGHRLSGAFAQAQSRAPILGSTFAVWSGLFHAFECVISQRHPDPNTARSAADAAACGFLTAGLLSIRYGPRAASTNAVFGGIAVFMIEKLVGR